MVAGVCSGIADRLGIDPGLVRVITVVLTVITGGVAAVGYGLLWAAMPVAGEGFADRWKPRRGSRRDGSDNWPQVLHLGGNGYGRLAGFSPLLFGTSFRLGVHK
ncbi:MAG: PspC domain-containing protein, partial [Dehalococcoidia bacterium]|nr:PspC domain-containing protein [Dehalococcoidia bacterium]